MVSWNAGTSSAGQAALYQILSVAAASIIWRYRTDAVLYVASQHFKVICGD